MSISETLIHTIIQTAGYTPAQFREVVELVKKASEVIIDTHERVVEIERILKAHYIPQIPEEPT